MGVFRVLVGQMWRRDIGSALYQNNNHITPEKYELKGHTLREKKRFKYE